MVLRLSFDDSLEITMEDSVNRKAKGGGCVRKEMPRKLRL